MQPAKRARAYSLGWSELARGTLGSIVIKNDSPRSGRQTLPGTSRYRPLRGLQFLFYHLPRVSLAKPRFTLGYMQSPASQAEEVRSHRL